MQTDVMTVIDVASISKSVCYMALLCKTVLCGVKTPGGLMHIVLDGGPNPPRTGRNRCYQLHQIILATC